MVTTVRTLIPLTCAACLVVLEQCWAADQKDRFLEFPNYGKTTTYDLSTVQIIQPGRFSVISTTIDDPDLMKLELKALSTLRTYCARPAGKYPAPAGLLTLGSPDMPVKSVEVQGEQMGRTKRVVFWEYPYTRLGKSSIALGCGEQDQMYEQQTITNGFRTKELFDCRRGLSGRSYEPLDNGDPSKVLTYAVRPDTISEEHYLGVCSAVMHEKPYLPERAGQ